MAMRINSNLAAMNAHRNLQYNDAKEVSQKIEPPKIEEILQKTYMDILIFGNKNRDSNVDTDNLIATIGPYVPPKYGMGESR